MQAVRSYVISESGVRNVGGASRFWYIQSSEIIPNLGVVTPQKFVGASGHVDVIGLAFGTFPVHELVHWLIRSESAVDGDGGEGTADF